MTDELLTYYNRELAYIRNMGAEFSEANPRIAARLRMAGGTSVDPHVERLIEAFAFLAARTRHKIEDEFPEICESLLSILYPHYLAPMPSASIVQCRLHASQSQLTSGYEIPRGQTIETERTTEGESCKFRTCYDVSLWPIEVNKAEFQAAPFSAPETPAARQAQAIIRIQLKSLSSSVPFEQYAIDSLSFFLNGSGQYIFDLYEVIMNNTLAVAVADSAEGEKFHVLDKSCIQPIGFERDEGLVDYSPRSFLGYRLLTEFFSFPQKFMFFKLGGLNEQILSKVGANDSIELILFVDRNIPELQQQVTAETFRLGCTPMINQYSRRAEAIHWTQTQTEYRVVPDARRPTSHEVYSIDKVVGTSPDGQEVEFAPFYSTKHATGNGKAFWHASRRAAGYAGGKVDNGTEVYLSLVDLDFQPSDVASWTIDVQTTCLNRDQPAWLEFGGGQPHLSLTTGGGLAQASCLTAPTKTLRPPLRHSTIWRLISHLSLNHLSLISQENGVSALREILMLYDPFNSEDTLKIVNSVEKVSSRRVVGRVKGAAQTGFCRGVEIALEMNEDNFTGSGIFLFGSVLERFFSLYSTLNSFTQTVIRSNRRPGDICKWRPRAGEHVEVGVPAQAIDVVGG